MRFTRLLPAEVVGTDLAFGLLLSVFAGGIHATMSGVPWAILLKLLAGGVPAVLIGTQLTTILSPRKMRLALCVWLIYIGAQLSLRAFQTPTVAAKPGHATKWCVKARRNPPIQTENEAACSTDLRLGWFDSQAASVDVPESFFIVISVVEEGDSFKVGRGRVEDTAHSLFGLWILLNLRHDICCSLRAFTEKPDLKETLCLGPHLTGYAIATYAGE